MSDFDDILGGLEEPAYQETQKKGAPQLDDADLAGLLDDEPEVWTGNEQKRGAPVLDASQVALDEPEQAWQEHKPASSAQPVIDDVNDLLGSEPAAYDPVAEFCNKLQFDDNLRQAFVTLDAEKQMQVVNMRAQQLGIPVPMIPNELRPKAPAPAENTQEEEVMLEEAPQAEEYVPKFKDEDLERAKAEAQKPRKYEPPPMEMSEEQKKENIRLMAQMREERERQQAKKGFQQLIVLTIVGIVGAVAFCLLFGGTFGLGNKLEEEGNLAEKVGAFSGYIGGAIGICSLLLAAPVPAVRGLCKFLDIVGFLMTLFAGIPLLMQTEGTGAVNGILLAVSALACGGSAITLITSDNISMYNKHGSS